MYFTSLNPVILKKWMNIFSDILAICLFGVLAEETMEKQIKLRCVKHD